MMQPSTNDFIIIYFKTGLQVSGNVIYWSDTDAVLENETKTTKTVINNPLEDILFYKIFTGKKELKKIEETPIKSDDDIARFAEIKQQENVIEKQELKERIFEASPNITREIKYGLPISALKVTSPEKHTPEKTPRTNNGIGEELQNLFRKENRTK